MNPSWKLPHLKKFFIPIFLSHSVPLLLPPPKPPLHIILWNFSVEHISPTSLELIWGQDICSNQFSKSKNALHIVGTQYFLNRLMNSSSVHRVSEKESIRMCWSCHGRLSGHTRSWGLLWIRGGVGHMQGASLSQELLFSWCWWDTQGM